MSRRREFYGAVGGAVLFALATFLVAHGLRDLFHQEPSISTESAGGSLVFDSASGSLHLQPIVTIRGDHAPRSFIEVAERETGRVIQRIDRDGTMHPNYRKKFRLLEKKFRRVCACGCCTGDVREGRTRRVDH